MTTISTQVLDNSAWNDQQTKILNQARPGVPENLTEKHRWLQCIVRNATDFQILSTGVEYDSGRSEKAPSDVQAFTLEDFTCCNSDGTIFAGVSGGAAFEVRLDSKHSFYFSIGFTNPELGSQKVGVVASRNPMDGYNAATGTGGNLDSEAYKAKDKDGNEVDFKIRVTAEATENHPEFKIKELR